MATNIVIVNDMDPSVAGALTYWMMSGDTSYPALVQALQDRLPNRRAPSAPSPDKALRRAVVGLRQRRRLVRPLGAKVGGWAIVDEVPLEGTLIHNATCYVKLAAPNNVGELVSVEPADHTLAPMVRADFVKYLEQLSHGDLSGWLVRTVYRLGAVALRDTGGIYFIPKDSMAEWRLIREVVKEAGHGHEVFTIPALKAEDTVNAVVRALEAEAEQELKYLQEAIAEGELGARALETRAGKCKSMLMKVRRYDSLLEQNQTNLVAKIEAMQAELVAASLAAEAEEAA